MAFSIGNENWVSLLPSLEACRCCDTVFHFVTHVLLRPDMHFLDAICWFPMVYYMVGSIDK